MATTRFGPPRGRGALFDAAGLHGRPHLRWLGGGALGVVMLLALGWLLLIRPEDAQTSRLRDRAATAQHNVDSLRQRLAEMRAQNSQLDRYRSELTDARAALPTTTDLSTFLRDLQSTGASSGIEVRGLIVGAPTQVTKVSGTIYALPVTLTAAGPSAKLDVFLNRLQRVQPRAVLINTANAVPDGNSAALSGTALLTLGLQVFVAPAAAAAPSSATTGPTPTASSTS